MWFYQPPCPPLQLHEAKRTSEASTILGRVTSLVECSPLPSAAALRYHHPISMHSPWVY